MILHQRMLEEVISYDYMSLTFAQFVFSGERLAGKKSAPLLIIVEVLLLGWGHKVASCFLRS